jgi:hypothetical protein
MFKNFLHYLALSDNVEQYSRDGEPTARALGMLVN